MTRIRIFLPPKDVLDSNTPFGISIGFWDTQHFKLEGSSKAKVKAINGGFVGF
jgi:hypothetical protein